MVIIKISTIANLCGASLLWFVVSWAVTEMCGQTRPGVFRRIIPILIVPQASESQCQMVITQPASVSASIIVP